MFIYAIFFLFHFGLETVRHFCLGKHRVGFNVCCSLHISVRAETQISKTINLPLLLTFTFGTSTCPSSSNTNYCIKFVSIKKLLNLRLDLWRNITKDMMMNVIDCLLKTRNYHSGEVLIFFDFFKRIQVAKILLTGQVWEPFTIHSLPVTPAYTSHDIQ